MAFLTILFFECVDPLHLLHYPTVSSSSAVAEAEVLHAGCHDPIYNSDLIDRGPIEGK